LNYCNMHMPMAVLGIAILVEVLPRRGI
jgi:hypothetical protein